MKLYFETGEIHVNKVKQKQIKREECHTKRGDKFRELEDLYVVYISEFDVFHSGYTKYHVDSVVRETGRKVKDGLERIFVNTEIKDGTELSELMTCFLEKEVDNPNFPEFSKRMKFLKHEKGGLDAVCDVMEKYEEIAVEKANIKAVKNMIKIFHATKQQILQMYSETEYEQAVRELEEEEAK